MTEKDEDQNPSVTSNIQRFEGSLASKHNIARSKKLAAECALTGIKLPPELLELLTEINGQDAYNVEVDALSTIPKDQYLVLPDTLALNAFDAKVVGQGFGNETISFCELIQIAALNYMVCPAQEERTKIIFGFIRAFAVSIGWRVDNNEVKKVAWDVNVHSALGNRMTEWFTQNAILAAKLRTLAFMSPFFTRHMFHVSGHHYMAASTFEYNQKYNRLFVAAGMQDMLEVLPRDLLHHTVLHWILPAAPQKVLDLARVDSDVAARVPNSVFVRAGAGPAGTAIITTTAAVLESMAAPGFLRELEKIYPKEIQVIRESANQIHEAPPKFHLVCKAYGLAPLSKDEQTFLALAKVAAKKVAPVAQAYINAYARESSLGQARALAKHAAEDPFLLKTMEHWFRAYAKRQKDCVTMRELLIGDAEVESVNSGEQRAF